MSGTPKKSFTTVVNFAKIWNGKAFVKVAAQGSLSTSGRSVIPLEARGQEHDLTGAGRDRSEVGT